MHEQKIKNKRIIGIIYGILTGFLVIFSFSFIITISLFILSLFNPEIHPSNPVMDIPLKISEKATLFMNSGIQEEILINDAFISFNFNSSTGKIAIINFMFYLSFIIIALSIIYLLWKIFRSIRSSLKHENVFNYRNVWRIRYIAFIVMLSAIIEIIYPVLFKYILFNHVQIWGNNLELGLNFDAAIDIVWSLVILVIAEIYRIGLEIKRDQELTI